MKWLLNEDEDVLTGVLLGCFIVTALFFFFFFNPWLSFLSFIFLVVWIYALIKREKIKKHKSDTTP